MGDSIQAHWANHAFSGVAYSVGVVPALLLLLLQLLLNNSATQLAKPNGILECMCQPDALGYSATEVTWMPLRSPG